GKAVGHTPRLVRSSLKEIKRALSERRRHWNYLDLWIGENARHQFNGDAAKFRLCQRVADFKNNRFGGRHSSVARPQIGGESSGLGMGLVVRRGQRDGVSGIEE